MKYQVIIIGGGPAGYTAAESAGKAGLSVLLIEKNNLGGKKIWITESNTRADGDAKIDIGLPGIRAQSFEQGLL